MRRGRVLIVDDKPSMLAMLARVLGDAFDVETASDGDRAAARVDQERFDVVLTDLRMPGKDGLALLKHIKAHQPHTEVILMTAHGTVQTAVDAMHHGAFDYLTKPFEPDEAVARVHKALEVRRLRDRVDALVEAVDERAGFEQLRGRSVAMQRVFSLLEKAAALDITVLITGPSGTGKELAARALHSRSARKKGPFVAVNCGALPAELIESELFGHKRGAFTGATEDKAGLVEEAANGTLLLDEIGDLPLPLQVKLNRALQEREFRRVGETRDRKVEARIVAATNVDLKARVADGRFREDLLYRLRVLEIQMPPLAARAEDLPLLCEHFRARAVARMGRGPTEISQAALRALVAYPWPGNVRELENAIERACALADTATLLPSDLPLEIVEGTSADAPQTQLAALSYKDAMELVRERATKEYLIALLSAFDGNVSRAAERAGVARESLHRLLKRHDVSPEAYRRA